jgi:hypothetical protein
MTLEETLAKLSDTDPSKIDWEMDDDPNGNLKAVFFKKNGERCCIFCKKPIDTSNGVPAMEIETTDRGQLYVFFCSKYCFGAPKVQA